MQKKINSKPFITHFFSILLVLALNPNSVANELMGYRADETATSAETIEVAAPHLSKTPQTVATEEATNETATSAETTEVAAPHLSKTPQTVAIEEATTNKKTAKSIEKDKLEKEQAAIKHLKTVLSSDKKEEETAEAEKNPYEVLVKLAFRGKGTNGINSYEEAAELYCKKAKEQNDANAEFALGWMYANGRGLEKDENVAALFFTKAAKQGHPRAKKWLSDTKGDANIAKVPDCYLPDPPPEPEVAVQELAPAGSSGNDFYDRGPIFEIVERLAPQYYIETDLAMAFIKVESNFNPRATSPKNAQGLMQLIPETSKRFNVKNPYDPEDNIKGGLAYLQWLLAYYEGDVRLVAAAYNAGENAVDRYKGVPPYSETRRYVSKIYTLYRKSFHPFRDDLLVGEKSAIIRLSRNP